MDKYAVLIGTIVKELGTQFRHAPNKSIDALRQLMLPEVMIDFYVKYEPVTCGRGQIRLWPIADMIVENTQAVPGVGIHPHRYVVFASTFSGDAYCFNLNKLNSEGEPEIVLISHGCVAEDCTAEQAHRAAKAVATSLLQFLEQYRNGTVDEECVYPE